MVASFIDVWRLPALQRLRPAQSQRRHAARGVLLPLLPAPTGGHHEAHILCRDERDQRERQGEHCQQAGAGGGAQPRPGKQGIEGGGQDERACDGAEACGG